MPSCNPSIALPGFAQLLNPGKYIALPGFEPGSRAPKARILDHYTTGLSDYMSYKAFKNLGFSSTKYLYSGKPLF